MFSRDGRLHTNEAVITILRVYVDALPTKGGQMTPDREVVPCKWHTFLLVIAARNDPNKYGEKL